MTSVAQVIKGIGPKLVPFFKTVAIYFVVFIPYDNPCFMATVLKCLPIISLMIFVLLHGMSFSDEYRFARRILIGLIFCCIGDAFLIYPSYFELGMVSFAIGHLNYIVAFGFHPLKSNLGLFLYMLNALGILYLLPGLSGSLLIGVPIYSFILTTMLWRAIARVQLFEDLWTWSKLCSCAGGFFFVLSDAIIGYTYFKNPLQYDQVMIMSTYYAAQLGIALSIVDLKMPPQVQSEINVN